MSSPGPNENVPQISQPTADLQSLTHTTQLLKQAVDNLAGFRGDQLGRAVTFNDLTRLGLADEATIKSPQGAADFATNSALQATADAINGTITAFTSTPHTWIAEQKFSSADGSVGVLISGVSKGLQFVPSASGMTIEATSNTGTGHQPLVIDASTITLQLSDVDKVALTTSGFNLGIGLQINGFNFATQTAFYNVLYDNAGNQSVFLGNASDPTNYYRNTGHSFGSIGGGATYSYLDASGMSLWNGAEATGGRKGAGTLNAYGLYIGGVGLQTVATNSQNTTAAPTGSTSGTGVHMGLAASITPSRSGTIEVTIYGTSSHTNSGGSMGLQIRTGTGSAPTNGAALTGTAQGRKIDPSTASAGQKMAFSLTVIVSGLSVGTAVWADLSLDNGGAGTATVQNVVVTAREL